MFIDPTAKILDLDGEAIMIDPAKPATVGYLVVSMLMAQFKDEENLSGDKKLDRFALAEKFHGAMLPVEIDNTQAELILRLAEKGLPILTYARLSRVIKAAQAAPAIMPARPNGKGRPMGVEQDRAAVVTGRG